MPQPPQGIAEAGLPLLATSPAANPGDAPSSPDVRSLTATSPPALNGVPGATTPVALKRAAPATPDADEYAPAPTLYYFLLKAGIGALSLVFLAVAWVLRPRECVGVCFVDPSLHHGRCPALDPGLLFYPRIIHSQDDVFVSSLLHGGESKGFNHVALSRFPEATLSSPHHHVDEDSALAFHTDLCSVLGRGTPWLVRTKSNRTLFEGHTFAVDFEACLGQNSPSVVATIGLVRRPRDLLYDVFERRNDSRHSFSDCVRDPSCVKALGLDKACGIQTRTFCGFTEECTTAQGLERAKRNIDSAILVGIAEEPMAVVSMARRVLPTYFEFVAVFSRPASAPALPRAVQEAVDELCSVDNELYAHAAHVFADKAHKCGVLVNAEGAEAKWWWSWPWPSFSSKQRVT